jgi:hypothetical protein
MHPIIQKTLGALITLALLTGCDSNAGNEYIGTWETTVNIGGDDTKLQFEISRNGENFLLRQTVGSLDPVTNPGTYKDGILQAPNFALVIDKKSGKLVSDRAEYVRVK